MGAVSNKKVSADDKKIKIGICDDHYMITDSLSRLIESDLELKNQCTLVFTAHSGKALLNSTDLPRINFLILDIDLPDLNGFVLAEKIKATHPGIKILILTVSMEKEYFQRMMGIGIDGYIGKRDNPEVLISAIKDIWAGRLGISPTFSPLTSYNKKQDLLAELYNMLSPREREVFALVIQDWTSNQIAKKLSCSEATISQHRKNIIHKLQTKDLHEWYKLGRRLNLF